MCSNPSNRKLIIYFICISETNTSGAHVHAHLSTVSLHSSKSLLFLLKTNHFNSFLFAAGLPNNNSHAKESTIMEANTWYYPAAEHLGTSW